MYLSKLVLNPRNPRARFELQNPYEIHRTLLCALGDCLTVEQQRERSTADAENSKRMRLAKRAEVLFRIEDANRGVLLVQTAAKPDWTLLENRAGYLCRVEPPKEYSVDDLLERTTADETGRKLFAFRLRARPSHKPKDQSRFTEVRKEGHRRVALKSDEQVLRWLLSQGERNGFEVSRKGPAIDPRNASIECAPEAAVLVGDERTVFRCQITRMRWKDNKRMEKDCVKRVDLDYYAELRSDMAPPSYPAHLRQDRLGRELRPLERLGWLTAVQFDGVLVVTDPDKLREAVRNGIGPQKAFGFGLLSLAPLRE